MIADQISIIEPVEWYVAPDPDDPLDRPHYRSCDLCDYTATDGIGSDPNWLENSRPFWKDHESGLSVCGACIEGFLLEESP